jgi:hypothetical protein
MMHNSFREKCIKRETTKRSNERGDFEGLLRLSPPHLGSLPNTTVLSRLPVGGRLRAALDANPRLACPVKRRSPVTGV